MKYLSFLLVTVLVSGLAACQVPAKNDGALVNLGFEKVSDGQPSGWYVPKSEMYSIQVDSVIKHSGKYSICISSMGDSASFIAISQKLPANYAGHYITLSGYIKTENVSGGRAGLWLRIDPRIAFDNMSKTEVTGTTDWKKYEIRLMMNPDKTDGLMLGGLLIGRGKVWLDELEVKIDGKPLSEAVVYKKEPYLADKDTAFKNGSGITTLGTDKQTLQNLKVLGLVWGYLKFYHPNIAAGKFNWANRLFKVLPKVATAKTDKERDALLSELITSLGSFAQISKKQKDAGPFKLKVDTSWFNTNGLSSVLKTQLRTVFTGQREPKGYYYSFERSQNVYFPNDKQMPDIQVNDIGARLLALYRYWNAIEYFFPYRYLIADWQKVLTQYIPRMIDADTRLKYEQCMIRLIGETKDTHGDLTGNTKATSAYYGGYSPALGVAYIQNKWVVNRYLDSIKGPLTGIKIGDVLEKIDGRPVESLVQARLDLTPASNMAAKYRNISWTLLRTQKDSMVLTYSSGGAGRQVKMVKTYNAHILPIIQFMDKTRPSFKFLKPDIGYIYPGSIKISQVDGIMRKAASTKGVIVDLRCYPSEFIVFSLGATLTEHPVDFVKFGRIDPLFPGRVLMMPPLKVGNNNARAYTGKVVVLVNESTQSQAEYTSMMLRAVGATIIGSTTAGADGNVSQMALPGGMSTYFSGLGVYYPDGTETQQVGIVPDIKCTPTIEGIREGRDELLERAVKFIDGGQ